MKPISKAFTTFITNNPKLKEAYRDAEGYYLVVMAGLCDDGDHGRHTVIDTVAAEVIRRVKNATPCKCGECKPVDIEPAKPAYRDLYADCLNPGDIAETNIGKWVVISVERKLGSLIKITYRLIDSLKKESFTVPVHQSFRVEGKTFIYGPAKAAKALNEHHYNRGGGFYVDFGKGGCARCFKARVSPAGVVQVMDIQTQHWHDLNPATDTVRNYLGTSTIAI